MEQPVEYSQRCTASECKCFTVMLEVVTMCKLIGGDRLKQVEAVWKLRSRATIEFRYSGETQTHWYTLSHLVYC